MPAQFRELYEMKGGKLADSDSQTIYYIRSATYPWFFHPLPYICPQSWQVRWCQQMRSQLLVNFGRKIAPRNCSPSRKWQWRETWLSNRTSLVYRSRFDQSSPRKRDWWTARRQIGRDQRMNLKLNRGKSWIKKGKIVTHQLDQGFTVKCKSIFR